MTKRLLLLNGLAALMVVLNHTSYYGFQAMFFWTDRYRPVDVPNFDQAGSGAYYFLFLSHQLAELAIPAFLFVSGFFMAFAGRSTNPRATLALATSRSKKLIIPFLVWTVLFTLIEKPFPLTLEHLLTRYYYIPLIIQFYLLSPVLIPLARKQPIGLLLLAAVIQFGRQSLRHFIFLGLHSPGVRLLIDITPVWFFPGHLFYFTLGIVAGLYITEFGQLIKRYRWALLGGTASLLVLTVVEYNLIAIKAGKEWLGFAFSGFSRNFFAVAAVLTFLAFDEVSYPYQDKLSQIGSKSLGIYLVNMPAIHVGAWLLYWLIPWLLSSQLFLQPLFYLLGLGIPLLLMAIFSRPQTKGAYRYLFG
jgi:membrane-bound acyltransferase YfiQ involved in biofilm formation